MTRAIPQIGLGTWPLSGAECRDTVAMALDLGYRHVDTAQMYGNEVEVGQGIRDCAIPRDDIYLVTKIHQDRFRDGTVLDSAKRSVDALDAGPTDLMLVHWPPRGIDTGEVIETLEQVRDAGLTKAIGVSNFNRPQLRAAAEVAQIATNQVEFHLLINQQKLLETANALGIPLTAYMPIARGKVLDHPVVRHLAEDLGKTPAQIALRWVLQKGVIAICMSTKRDNLAANLGALDFALNERDMATLSALTSEDQRFCRMPEWEPDWNAD